MTNIIGRADTSCLSRIVTKICANGLFKFLLILYFSDYRSLHSFFLKIRYLLNCSIKILIFLQIYRKRIVDWNMWKASALYMLEIMAFSKIVCCIFSFRRRRYIICYGISFAMFQTYTFEVTILCRLNFSCLEAKMLYKERVCIISLVSKSAVFM